MMSQLHHEGLRKQMIADKKATAADFSWLVSEIFIAQFQPHMN